VIGPNGQRSPPARRWATRRADRASARPSTGINTEDEEYRRPQPRKGGCSRAWMRLNPKSASGRAASRLPADPLAEPMLRVDKACEGIRGDLEGAVARASGVARRLTLERAVQAVVARPQLPSDITSSISVQVAAWHFGGLS
jgi:hypothetical protein